MQTYIVTLDRSQGNRAYGLILRRLFLFSKHTKGGVNQNLTFAALLVREEKKQK